MGVICYILRMLVKGAILSMLPFAILAALLGIFYLFGAYSWAATIIALNY